MIEAEFLGLKIEVRYDQVTKRVEVQSNAADDLTVLGMLELAKSALLMRQIQANNGGLQIVVPAPRRIS